MNNDIATTTHELTYEIYSFVFGGYAFGARHDVAVVGGEIYRRGELVGHVQPDGSVTLTGKMESHRFVSLDPKT
ncbi:hypothetical protein LZC95_50120 [Pendulispora brunnea]|uniref:Uncharacterized protein n=1 Tax=Pendulispora brunnea TaxID=2905690 RepID=A0ABZ2K796_9BACT